MWGLGREATHNKRAMRGRGNKSEKRPMRITIPNNKRQYRDSIKRSGMKKCGHVPTSRKCTRNHMVSLAVALCQQQLARIQTVTEELQ